MTRSKSFQRILNKSNQRHTNKAMEYVQQIITKHKNIMKDTSFAFDFDREYITVGVEEIFGHKDHGDRLTVYYSQEIWPGSISEKDKRFWIVITKSYGPRVVDSNIISKDSFISIKEAKSVTKYWAEAILNLVN